MSTEAPPTGGAPAPAGSFSAERGPYFGRFGGRFVPEALVAALDEIAAAHAAAMADEGFLAELAELHRTYSGRPSIITEVPRFAAHNGGARRLLKPKDFIHTGSHKINNMHCQEKHTRLMVKQKEHV